VLRKLREETRINFSCASNDGIAQRQGAICGFIIREHSKHGQFDADLQSCHEDSVLSRFPSKHMRGKRKTFGGISVA